MSFEQDASNVARIDSALAQDVAEYEALLQQAVSAGQLLTAIEIARDGLSRFGKSPKFQQQLALALAQTGALEAAQEVLRDLMKESARDQETLSLLGRVHKEMWRRAQAPADAAAAAQRSCTFYGDAFALSSHYYPGINLAFMLAATGELVRAEEVARQVERICRAELARANGRETDGWLLATLAEALVHQGATSEAAQFYRKACSLFTGRWRDLASMRRQAREVLSFEKERKAGRSTSWRDFATIRRRAREWLRPTEPGNEWLDRCFEFPSVVVFSGHMLDHPDRAVPRFTADREAEVREAIRLHLLGIKAGIGYSSAACGADLVFCECLLEMEAKVNLVLPCSVEAFKRQSVNFAGPQWERRFHHVLANATSCISTSPTGNAVTAPQASSGGGLIYANRVATGLAALQARALDLELKALAVWDGKPAQRPGGTAHVVADWQRQNIPAHIIPLEPRGAAAGAGASAAAATSGASEPRAEVKQDIKAMLLAEVVNFQHIAEPQMPAFVEHFKGAMAAELRRLGATPAVAESWAGIHYFVYDDPETAGLIALAMRDRVAATPWAQHGLPATLGIRMVLHAGPVFTFVDPTLQRLTCVGSHVNRAARIEPITPAGQIYVTQEFAALCGAEGVASLSFEYLGYLRTTTMFEDAALYRLDHAPDEAAVGADAAARPAR